MCWALYLLAHHPEVQEKAIQELDQIFKDDPDRHVTLKDAGEMKYLERVIKETLRYLPVVPFISRKLEEDIKLGKHV